MRTSEDPLYKAACRICRRLQAGADRARENSSIIRLGQYVELETRCAALGTSLRRARLAARRRWTGAQQDAERAVQVGVDRLYEQIRSLAYGRASMTPLNRPSLTVHTVLGELRQLREEFNDVRIQLSAGLIAVQTESITLENLALGPFSLELHLDKMDYRPGSHCFDCVALDPNPARSNESITHPHVSGTSVCAGDAAAAISLALGEGRLCDAFLLVAAVLRQYNPSSPYVALEKWHGVACPGCDRRRDAEDMYSCQTCDQQVCADCSGVCSRCEESFCLECLERDPESSDSLCRRCRDSCQECGRLVNRDDLIEALCPQCHEAQDVAEAAESSSDDEDAVVLALPVQMTVPEGEADS